MPALLRESAYKIAAAHAGRTRLGHPDYWMGCELVGRIGDEWLVAYRVRCRRDVATDKQGAGTGGFIVTSIGQVRDLSIPAFLQARREAVT